jgi:cytochrome c-type biogenesis protein
MNSPESIGLLVAFSAGILSFLSPCVLPLVPSYVGFLTGMSLEDANAQKRHVFLHALLFVLGFTLIFVVLGASATALGRALKAQQVWLTRGGGVLIIVFGLYCLGVLKLGALQAEKRVHLQDKPVGYLGSVLVGMAFAAGWTPCIGPILGAILSLAATSGDASRGTGLLLSYSLGLAVPFLAAALAVDRFIEWFKKFRTYLPWVMRASGVMLIIVGVLMVTGEFTRLAALLQGFTPSFLKEQL